MECLNYFRSGYVYPPRKWLVCYIKLIKFVSWYNNYADVMEYSHKTDAHLVKHKQHKTQCETLGAADRDSISR